MVDCFVKYCFPTYDHSCEFFRKGGLVQIEDAVGVVKVLIPNGEVNMAQIHHNMKT